MRDLLLVTGGAGFIGSAIAADLAARGARVVVCDWLGTDDKWRNLSRLALHDLIRPDALRPWLAAHADRLEAVVHMGAISATTERDGDRLVSENIRLTLDLWEWCAHTRTAFLYASSAATYGDGAEGFSDEDSPAALARLKPLNAYGWSKHLVDARIARDRAENRPEPPKWAGLKFFNVYGPGEAHKGPMRSVVLQVHEKVRDSGVVTLFRSHNPAYPDGGQKRDFVAVSDCAAVVAWMLEHDFPSGIYNLGTGQARTFLDLARAVFAAWGAPERIAFIDTPAEIRPRYQYFTEADLRRLRLAGCEHVFARLEQGVAAYVAALRAEEGR